MFFASGTIFAGQFLYVMGRKPQQVPLVLVGICILTELHRLVGSKQDSTNIMTFFFFFKKRDFLCKSWRGVLCRGMNLPTVAFADCLLTGAVCCLRSSFGSTVRVHLLYVLFHLHFYPFLCHLWIIYKVFPGIKAGFICLLGMNISKCLLGMETLLCNSSCVFPPMFCSKAAQTALLGFMGSYSGAHWIEMSTLAT